MKNKILQRVASLVRPEILSLKAYGVVDAGDLIKLDAMENPYPWPETVKQAWADRMQQIPVNRYPDPHASSLIATLRQTMSVPDDLAMMLGNGSDELIQIIMMALARPGSKVLAPVPTFVMYKMTAGFTGMEFIPVPLNANDFSLDMGAMLASIEKHQPAIIFLSYPNNPTGNLFAVEDIEIILGAAEGLVVIDEAYHVFADQSFMARIGEFENIAVMRTLSKLGLAGLRLGVLVAAKSWMVEFDKIRLPYNINSLTQVSAEFILKNADFLEQQTANICSARDAMYADLTHIDAIDAWQSQANFILFRVHGVSADDVYEGLRQRGVLIKNLDKADSSLAGCLRVTVGTPQENSTFLTALKEVM